MLLFKIRTIAYFILFSVYFPFVVFNAGVRSVAGVSGENATRGNRAGGQTTGVHSVIADQSPAGLRAFVLQRVEGAQHSSTQRK